MFRIIYGVFVVLLATGCNLSSLDDKVVVPEVEDEFYLDFWEDFSEEGRFLEFRLQTIADEPCENATIDYGFQQFNRGLSIAINEIVVPDDCTGGEAPATAQIRVDRPLSNAFYSLEVALRDAVRSEGEVLATSSAYRLSLEEGGGIILLRPELLRIPDGIIWGYAAAASDEYEAPANAFLAQLRSISSLKALSTGYYGYFNIAEGRLTFTGGVAPVGAKTFFYNYQGEEEALAALTEEFRTVYGDALEVKVFTTKGKVF